MERSIARSADAIRGNPDAVLLAAAALLALASFWLRPAADPAPWPDAGGLQDYVIAVGEALRAAE